MTHMPPSPITARRARGGAALAAVLVLAAVLAGAPRAGRAEGTGFKVVVHEGSAVRSLHRDALSRLFLGKAAEWPDGSRAVPVDQREGSAARDAFTRFVHRRSLQAVKLLWQQAIFSGRALPPPEVNGDAAVLAHVRANPGAVGYVSPSASLGEGVRALQVEE